MHFELRLGRERVQIALPLLGAHYVANFTAAAAAAHALGVPAEAIASAATRLRPARHRGELRRLGERVVLLDDCYNSSPAALEAAVEALALVPGRRHVAILGDMLELGPRGPQLHRERGRALVGRVDLVLAVGPLGREILAGAAEAGLSTTSLQHFEDAARAAAAVGELVQPGDAVLVKASRGVHLERIVEAMVARFGEGAA
jgi:UDP-N-acetylmuramoyl-tripeptide--D-alanyl-D-alanine ligase